LKGVLAYKCSNIHDQNVELGLKTQTYVYAPRLRLEQMLETCQAMVHKEKPTYCKEKGVR
jgi:hypothetical protein